MSVLPFVELEGRVAIVTGGASGIGRATCLALARAGADIVIFDQASNRSTDVCREVVAIGRHAEHIFIDLNNLKEIPVAVAEANTRFSRIDILVNSAGVRGGTAPMLDLQMEAWDRTHRIDLTAPFLMMQCCARLMVDAGRGGRIVNVASSAAFRSSGTAIDYASAKSGLIGASRSAAGQLAVHDINVNCVAPGVTSTAMTSDNPEDLQTLVESGPLENLFHRVSTPEDVAAAVVFLCTPGSRQITGQTIHTSAGAVV